MPFEGSRQPGEHYGSFSGGVQHVQWLEVTVGGEGGDGGRRVMVMVGREGCHGR